MSPLFDELKHGLEEAIAFENDKNPAKVTILEIRPIQSYDKKEIRTIRIRNGMSQSMMASFMGVSKKTVEAWESGRNKPSGTACRLLEILSEGSVEGQPFVIVSQ